MDPDSAWKMMIAMVCLTAALVFVVELRHYRKRDPRIHPLASTVCIIGSVVAFVLTVGDALDGEPVTALLTMCVVLSTALAVLYHFPGPVLSWWEGDNPEKR